METHAPTLKYSPTIRGLEEAAVAKQIERKLQLQWDEGEHPPQPHASTAYRRTQRRRLWAERRQMRAQHRLGIVGQPLYRVTLEADQAMSLPRALASHVAWRGLEQILAVLELPFQYF